MALHAMWVDGAAVVPERVGNPVFENVRLGGEELPWTDVGGWRGPTPRGSGPGEYGARYRGRTGATAVFHFAIPTPVIARDQRVRLEKAFLLVHTDQARVTSVFVTQRGRERSRISDMLVRADRVSLSGDQSFPGDANYFIPGDRGETRSPEVWFGIKMSVHVTFEGAENFVTFVGAGADFSGP